MSHHNPSKETTAADVAQFLSEHAAQLAEATGNPFAYIYVEAGNPKYPNGTLGVKWKTYSAATERHHEGVALDEVLAATIAAASPDEKAKYFREQAAALLAKAALLSPEATEKGTR